MDGTAFANKNERQRIEPDYSQSCWCCVAVMELTDEELMSHRSPSHRLTAELMSVSRAASAWYSGPSSGRDEGVAEMIVIVAAQRKEDRRAAQFKSAVVDEKRRTAVFDANFAVEGGVHVALVTEIFWPPGTGHQISDPFGVEASIAVTTVGDGEESG